MIHIEATKRKPIIAAKDDDEIGTPNGQYAPPAMGPFACINCIHFNHIESTPMGGCDHPKIIKDAREGYLPLVNVDGAEMAEVHHEGCSGYYNPGPIKATSIAHQ